MSGRRRAVREIGITLAQRADCIIALERQNRAGNGELRGRRRGGLRVSSQRVTLGLNVTTDRFALFVSEN